MGTEPAPPIPASPHHGSTSSGPLPTTTPSSQVPILPYYDDDAPEILADNDPPPEYSDYDPNANFRNAGNAEPFLPIPGTTNGLEPFSQNGNGHTVYYLDARLDTDPEFLEQHIRELSVEPPRPSVRIRGVHSETKKYREHHHHHHNDRQTHHQEEERSESKTVVDFDIQVDLTPLLYQDLARGIAWNRLAPVSNFDKVRRGTVLASRAPGFGGSGSVSEVGTPDISTWCRRFCADRAGLKTFSIDKRLVGWDFAVVGDRLRSLVRSTGYRGQVDVSFPTSDSRVEIWNACRTNRWRLTRWIELTFYFTFLWLFSWPWLYLRTKRYDTVYVEWALSRVDDTPDANVQYAAMSEDRWHYLWSRPIYSALMLREQRMLGQADLEEAWTAGEFARGVQAGLHAAQRSYGWGGDTVEGP